MSLPIFAEKEVGRSLLAELSRPGRAEHLSHLPLRTWDTSSLNAEEFHTVYFAINAIQPKLHRILRVGAFDYHTGWREREIVRMFLGTGRPLGLGKLIGDQAEVDLRQRR